MPKQDHFATLALREAGFFLPGSYITLDGHLILRGQDKSRVRDRVFRRFRNRCVICNHKLNPKAPPWTDDCGAWHHVKGCSCVGCSELRCDETTGRKCHAHRTVGFERVAPGVDALAKVVTSHFLKQPSRKLIAKRKARAKKHFDVIQGVSV